MPTSIATFADSEFRMRYREPYVTEGLNAKFAVNTPPGTYRGFRLATHASNDTITVEADAAALDHVVVYQTDDAFSLTIRKSGGDYAVDLSTLVDAAQKTWVIAIYAAYAVGSTTTATLRAYEYSPSDEFTTAPEKDELVVLGTVTIPAGGGVPIPAANIVHDRRTMAWDAQAAEALVWAPLLRNPGFELGRTGSTMVGAEIPFWEVSPVPAAGRWLLDDTDPHEGLNSLEFEYSSGTETTSVVQRMEMACAGLVRVRASWRPVQAATAGTAALVLHWRDATGGSTDTTSLSLDISGAGSYSSLDRLIVVPSATTILHEVEILLTGVSFASAASALRFDAVQVWSEVPNARSLYAQENRAKSQEITDLLVLADADIATTAGAALRHDSASPSGEGSVKLLRRDLDSALVHPALDLKGRLIGVGDSMIATIANAEKPRIEAAVSVATTYTLMWESEPSGSVNYRKYVSSTGEFVETTNARWSESAGYWYPDDNGEDAFIASYTPTGRLLGHMPAGPAQWFPGNWRMLQKSNVPVATTLANQSFAPLLEVADANNRNRVIVDHNGFRGGRVSEIRQDWLTYLGADPEDWVSGASGTGSVGFAYDQNFGRVSTLRLSTLASGDAANMYSGTRGFASMTYGVEQWRIWTLEWSMYLSDLTDMQVLAGFRKSIAPLPQSYFLFNPATDSHWGCLTSDDGGPADIYYTSVTPSTSTPQRFRIELYGANTPGGARVLYYIDGAVVYEMTNAAKMPDYGMYIWFALSQTSTGARDANIGPVRCTYNWNEYDDHL